MREGERAYPRGFQGAIRRERIWLAASALMAAAIIGVLLALGGYADRHRASASQATAADLAATQLNALEWQVIAVGRVSPGEDVRARQLLAAIGDHLGRIRPEGASVRPELVLYADAIRVQFELIALGRVGNTRQIDATLVEPSFRGLSSSLQRVVQENTRSAARASALATAGDVVTVGLGLAMVSLLLLRFAAARRALAAAEVEERLLRKTDKAKDNLISVVSHDLRTPLTSIIGYLEMLTDGEAGPLTGAQRRFLAVARRNADRLIAIVTDLLFIARGEEGKIDLVPAELSLVQAAADAVEDQLPAAEQAGVGLYLKAATAPPIVADRQRVDLLLANLLSNALKFTPAGGTVEVAVGQADGHVRLEVSDTGIGIPEQDQAHVFERFFRTPETIGLPGVGLGLSIVKTIADAHGAVVSVASVPGGGTTFRVDFPAGPGVLPADHERAPHPDAAGR
ncbi:MAG TPA: HAMP domain-containing sensor histidine kinase [Streptosporangiaceae bacterium]|nr:HAMP domain-containing sensor histidine kinase [Streptosporangiaceae bacterium]